MNQQNLPEDQFLSQRYARQLLLKQFGGLEGQHKIQKAKVLVIGAGGIGSTTLLYLASQGVGNIGILDNDTVEPANLHRQVIHDEISIGINKAISAKQQLERLNSSINIQVFQERLTQFNSDNIFKNYDIILDASDNPRTRYIVNDTAMIQKKIVVSSSALRWEGQCTIFGYKDCACYRCLYPECPKGNTVKKCAEVGVVGTLPGFMGIIQAQETIKLLIGLDSVLNGEMIIYDGLSSIMRKVKIRKRQQNCCLCGTHPSLTNVATFDYDKFVGDIKK